MPDPKQGTRPLAELVDRWWAEGRLVGGEQPAEDSTGGAGTQLTGVQDDSRLVARGNLFVAVKGLRVDGHDFVDEAVHRGAAAVAVERSVGDASVPQSSSSIGERRPSPPRRRGGTATRAASC